MNTLERASKSAQALEITATLAGRRFGLCGFDAGEAQRICRILCSANSLACVFDERLLSESSGICDAVLVKLASLSPEGLRAAATAHSPILVTGSSQALLEGLG